MEECPQHIRTVVSEARSLWPDYIPSDPSKLAECEFYLIEEMDSFLLVHHPYRSLMHLVKVLNLKLEDQQTSWAIVNDAYMTDLPLLYAPHIIALVAIYLSFHLKTANPSSGTEKTARAHEKKLVDWLAASPVDIKNIIDATQDLIALYEIWESYNEKQCKEVITKLVESVAKES